MTSEVVDLMIEFGRKLNDSVSMVQDRCSQEELEHYRRAVGKIMGSMLLDIMNPIFDVYPELKPDELE